MNDTRHTRTATPASVPSRSVMNGNDVVRQVDVGPGGRRARRARPARSTPATAHRSVTLVQYDAQVRPLGLEPLLEPVEHGRGAAGGRRDEVPVLGEAHRDPVVEHHPVEPEHQPVADRADRQVRHPVRVHAGRGRRRRRRRRPRSCRASRRRRCRRADAHGDAFARDGLVHRLAGRRGSTRGGATARRSPSGRPTATCHGCIGVVRTGSRSRGPVSTPASARNGTGVYGGRAFDGPCAPGVPPEQRVRELGGDDAARAALVDRRPDVGGPLHVLDAAEPRGRRRPPRRRPSGRAAARRYFSASSPSGTTQSGWLVGTSPAARPDDREPRGAAPVGDEGRPSPRRTRGRRRSPARARARG